MFPFKAIKTSKYDTNVDHDEQLRKLPLSGHLVLNTKSMLSSHCATSKNILTTLKDLQTKSSYKISSVLCRFCLPPFHLVLEKNLVAEVSWSVNDNGSRTPSCCPCRILQNDGAFPPPFEEHAFGRDYDINLWIRERIGDNVPSVYEIDGCTRSMTRTK